MKSAAHFLAFRLRVAYLVALAIGIVGLTGAGFWITHLLAAAENRQEISDLASHLGSTGFNAIEDSLLSHQSDGTYSAVASEASLALWHEHASAVSTALKPYCAANATLCQRFEVLSNRQESLTRHLAILLDGRTGLLTNKDRLIKSADDYHRNADQWATNFESVLVLEARSARFRFLATVTLLSLPFALLIVWIFETRIRHLERERRRADAWTTEQEQRAAVAEWTHHAVFITDSTGRITWANAAFTSLTGYSSPAASTAPFSTLLGLTDDDSLTSEAVNRQLAEGRGFQIEARQRKADGGLFWGSIDCRPYRDREQRLAGFVIIDSDISARKSAEAAHALSEQRLSHLADSLTSLISSWDSQAICQFANAAHREVFGIDPAAMVGRTIWDIFGDQTMGESRNIIERVLAGTAHRYEQEIPARDGTSRSYIIELVPQGQNRSKGGFYVIASDVNELKSSQQTIERQKALLDATSSIAGVGGWELTLATRQVTWSDTVFEIHGLAVGPVPPDVELQRLYSPAAAQRHRDALAAAIRHGTPYDLVLELTTARAERRWVRAVGVPVMEEQRCIRVIGALQDVTATREAAIALENARDAAEAANVAKGQFLANMSHEIRTPMNGVIGMLDLLEQHVLPDDARQMLETAQGSADALLTVINDILDFSKIEAGKLSIEHIDVPLRRMAEDVALLFSKQAVAKGVEIICAINNEVPEIILGDPTRLRQVLSNLMGNAVKFTDIGHVLLDVNVSRSEAQLRIAIQDSGIGMDEDAQRRLFNTFVQADGSTTRKYGGTGLGLAITKRLIEAMNGTIEVQSAPGHGSTFRVVLPLDPATTHNAPAVPSLLSNVRALIIDDNPINRRIFEHYLQWRGIHHRSVAGACEGLAALQEAAVLGTPYDVVLLDYQMPAMDGVEFLRQLRGGSTAADTPCIVLSSLGDRVDDIEHLNVSAWLTKPVRKLDLYTTLENVTGQSHAKPIVTPQKPSPSATEFADLRVMVAEDNLVNQMVARRVLQSFGIEVTICADGEAAFAAVKSTAFDLVFMDCQMPLMDGYQCTQAIRQREARDVNIPRLPVIAMTANALTGDRERCLEAGMDDYISKPIKRETVHSVLREWRTVRVTPAAQGSVLR